MFEITKAFTGGNIEIISLTENEARLKRELRDTSEEWFYWAFCVKGAQGKTVKFDIGNDYLGPFGPAVSHDLKNWHWLNKRDSDRCFTYTFSQDEACVYFAHDMLYHPKRFSEFSAILEKENEKNALKYFAKDNLMPDVGWNKAGSPCFGSYMGEMTDSVLSITLETCYFGTEKCVFNEKNALTLGQNFAHALNKFEEKQQNSGD